MDVSDKILKRLALIKSHPKYFIKYCTYTKNQADPDNSCQPFPWHLKFHRQTLEAWFQHEKIVVLKSRQMQFSWLMLAAHLWLAMTRKDQDIYIRRNNWKDALQLLNRIQYIYDNMPEAIWPKELRPSMKTKEGQIYFPELNSYIFAMAKGADQGRGETPSALLIDEFAFQEDASEFWSTLTPALQGKSKVTCISTPCPLYGDEDPIHRRLVEDRTGEGYAEEAKKTNEELNKWEKLQGYKIFRNPGNGFIAINCHYTADPEKRTDTWKKRMRSQMDAKEWATEMELSWETYAGEPVYGNEFNPDLHIAKEIIEPNPEYPILIRGWDFGGNHSCVLLQYYDGTVYVIKEWANVGYNTRKIAGAIQEECNLTYGNQYRYIEVIDPSARWEGRSSEGISCVDVMKDLGMEVVSGIQEPTKRIDAVMKKLITLNNGKPSLILSPRQCPMLERGFRGGYQYPEKATANQKKNRPLKNEFSHIHDALQYPLTKLHSIGMYEYDDIFLNDSLGGYTFDY